MKLDVIIPTFNRAESLMKTLRSLLQAELPNNFQVKVTVVNNNSTDNTESAVKEIMPLFENKTIEYLFEPGQGRSFALNTGIKTADGDLLTTVDDDIQVAENWFVEIEKIFRERWNEIDYIGGKMLPNWEDENIPDWIEPLKDGVIGWRDYGEEEWVYSAKTPILTGGHAIFKREIFDEIGLYTEGVGATGKNLMSCEDNILFFKLLNAEKKGIYAPQLKVFHFVPRYRLSKSYYRQWCFGAGKSWNLLDNHLNVETGKRIFGIPRYYYKEALYNLKLKTEAILKGNETKSLASENKILMFAGFFYARNFENSVIAKPLEKFFGKIIKSTER